MCRLIRILFWFITTRAEGAFNFPGSPLSAQEREADN